MPHPLDLPRFVPTDGLSVEGARKMNAMVAWIRPLMNITGAKGSPLKVLKNEHGISIDLAAQTAEPPKIIRDAWIVVRNILNPDLGVLEVEWAVEHRDFLGEEDPDNAGRFVPLSEFGLDATGPAPTDPDTELMAVWPHWKAGDYDLLRWPVGAWSDRSMDVLSAEFRTDKNGNGQWYAKPDLRMYLVKLMEGAPVGSCERFEDLEGL
jgi:hypothetical protein